ncbi:MAG TPA: hypothetical protein VFC04_05085 [Actinomycetota bacterium]|nr:hypothetical protein [Actinomycetota bacterium]
MTERPRRSARLLFTNWSSSEEPFGRKLRLALRNRWRATVLLKGCCGHPGEPGC